MVAKKKSFGRDMPKNKVGVDLKNEAATNYGSTVAKAPGPTKKQAVALSVKNDGGKGSAKKKNK